MSNLRDDGYILSRNIKVFPCSYRGHYSGTFTFDPESRLMSEYNITSLKAFGNLKSYVVSFDNNTLKCVIDGYYFEITDLTASDFITDTGTKKLYINTRDVTITESNDNTDSKRTTKVLASFEDETSTSLDLPSGSTYIFTGLKVSEEAVANAIEFDFINADGSIKENMYLPSIVHGVGANSIVFNNNPSSSAAGEKSVSFGDSTNVASGKYSAVFGTGTIADKNNLVAIGEYNTTEANDYFVVGNGDSIAKSNVFEVNKNFVKINKATIITGITDIIGNTSITGTENVSSTFTVNTNKFKVEANGNTTIAGTLTQNGGQVTFSGNVKARNGLDVTGAVKSSKKLTVSSEGADITGDTTILGTLVQSDSTTKAPVTFNGKVDAKNSLDVTGTVTSSNKLTVSNGGAAITGDTTLLGKETIKGDLAITTTVEDAEGASEEIPTFAVSQATGNLEASGNATFKGTQITLNNKVTLCYEDDCFKIKIN